MSDLFDLTLKQAIIENHSVEMAAIPSEEKLAKLYTFSDEHNKKIKKIFQADKQREIFIIGKKWGMIAACVLITFAALITNPNINPLLRPDTGIEVNPDFANFIPSYVPEGFEFSQAYRSKEYTFVMIDFIDQDGNTIKIDVNDNAGAGGFEDDPNVTWVEVAGGRNAYIYDFGTGVKMLRWWSKKYSGQYNITAELETEELIKIAESIEGGNLFE
jgi:hypothetical protein